MGMFSLETTEMFEGDIPLKEQALIQIFIEQNRDKLQWMWDTQEFEVIPLVE